MRTVDIKVAKQIQDLLGFERESVELIHFTSKGGFVVYFTRNDEGKFFQNEDTGTTDRTFVPFVFAGLVDLGADRTLITETVGTRRSSKAVASEAASKDT